VSLEPHLLALQMITPLLAAPIVALLRPRHMAWLTATLTSAMAFALAVAIARDVRITGALRYQMGGWQPPLGSKLHIGAFGALLLLLVTGASTLALLGCRASLDRQIESARQPWFYAAWLLAMAGLSGILVTGDAFNAFVFMEVSSLATYVLIAAGPDRRGLIAVFQYLVMGTIGATFYLIGVGLLYMMTGTLNFADLEMRLAGVTDMRPVLVAAAFITVGLALKAAVFPLHAWLPNAYARAPHGVTVFIAACATKVSLYVLIRFDFLVFQANLAGHSRQFTDFLVPLALLGMLIGSAVAMFERDLKKLLAWSSIGQLGYILLGAGLVEQAGLTASLTHMFAHSLAKATAFLAVAALALRHQRLDLSDLGGAFRRMPWTMGALVLAGVSLIGMPGTAGFVSKWLLIQAAMASGPYGGWLVAAILASSLMAVVYIWRIVEAAAFGPDTDPTASPRGEAPLGMLAVLWTAALANIWFGLDTGLQLDLAADAARVLSEHVDGR